MGIEYRSTTWGQRVQEHNRGIESTGGQQGVTESTGVQKGERVHEHNRGIEYRSTTRVQSTGAQHGDRVQEHNKGIEYRSTTGGQSSCAQQGNRVQEHNRGGQSTGAQHGDRVKEHNIKCRSTLWVKKNKFNSDSYIVKQIDNFHIITAKQWCRVMLFCAHVRILCEGECSFTYSHYYIRWQSDHFHILTATVHSGAECQFSRYIVEQRANFPILIATYSGEDSSFTYFHYYIMEQSTNFHVTQYRVQY